MVYFLVYFMTMIRLNIHEAKAGLSRHIRRLKPGESVLICRRNVPVAELRALPRETRERRPFGLARGAFVVPDDFDRALPEAELKAWERG